MKIDSRSAHILLAVALCVVLPCICFIGCQTPQTSSGAGLPPAPQGAVPPSALTGSSYDEPAYPSHSPPGTSGLNSPSPMDAYSQTGESTLRMTSSVLGLPAVSGPRPKAYVVSPNAVDSIGEGRYHRYMTDAERMRIHQQTQQAYRNMRYSERIY